MTVSKNVTEKQKAKRKKHVADKVTRRKARISFQVCGQQQLKFCKAVVLTNQVMNVFGRLIWKIVPREARNIENAYPVISIFRDMENRQLVLRCDRVKRYEMLVTDEHGNSKFEPIVL